MSSFTRTSLGALLLTTTAQCAIISLDLEVELFAAGTGSNILIKTGIIVDPSGSLGFPYLIGDGLDDFTQTDFDTANRIKVDLGLTNKLRIEGGTNSQGFDRITIKATNIGYDSTEILKSFTLDSSLNPLAKEADGTSLLVNTPIISEDGTSFQLDYVSTDMEVIGFGGYDDYTLNFGAVPEPSSIALLGLGSCCLLLRRKRS